MASSAKGASMNDVRALGWVVKKWTTVLISCVIMYVTRGGGGSKNPKISWMSLMEAP